MLALVLKLRLLRGSISLEAALGSIICMTFCARSPLIPIPAVCESNHVFALLPVTRAQACASCDSAGCWMYNRLCANPITTFYACFCAFFPKRCTNHPCCILSLWIMLSKAQVSLFSPFLFSLSAVRHLFAPIVFTDMHSVITAVPSTVL